MLAFWNGCGVEWAASQWSCWRRQCELDWKEPVTTCARRLCALWSLERFFAELCQCVHATTLSTCWDMQRPSTIVNHTTTQLGRRTFSVSGSATIYLLTNTRLTDSRAALRPALDTIFLTLLLLPSFDICNARLSVCMYDWALLNIYCICDMYMYRTLSWDGMKWGE